MKQYLSISEDEFKIIYDESCVSGSRYNKLLKYVKTYNKNIFKLKEFEASVKLIINKYNQYLKKLRKERDLLRKWEKRKKSASMKKKFDKRKKLYKQNVIKFKKYKINGKLQKDKYYKSLENFDNQTNEFEKLYEERENIFNNEYKYLEELGMDSLMLELLNKEYKTSINYLEVYQIYSLI